MKATYRLVITDPQRSYYGTAKFKLDICTRVLVQSLEKFGAELANFPRAHDPWHAFDPRDKLYARRVYVVYFTREQSFYM